MNRIIGQNISSALKGLVILIVFLAIVLIIQGIGTGFLEYQITRNLPADWDEPGLSEEQAKQSKIAWAEKKYLPDGTLHLIHSSTGDRFKDSFSHTAEVHDVDGHPVWKGLKTDIPFRYLKTTDFFWSRAIYYWRHFRAIDPSLSGVLIFPVVSEKKTITEYWRYDFQKGYFTGYTRNKQIIGYCGAGGFTDSRDDIRPFEPLVNFSAWTPNTSFTPRCFLLADSQLYEADFESRSLEKLIDSGGSSIIRIQEIDWKQVLGADPSSIPVILADLKDQPPVLIRKDPLRAIPLQVPDGLLKRGNFSLLSSGESFFLQAERRKNVPSSTDRKAYLAWLKENQYKPIEYRLELYQIEEDGALRPLNEFEYTRPAMPPSPRQLLIEKKFRQMRKAATFSAPPCFAWTHMGMVRLRERKPDLGRDYYLLKDFGELLEATYPQEPRIYYPTAAILMLLALLHYQPRRTGRGKITVWLAVIFCFNLAGFLTYLSLNHYPVLRCASCGRRRGLNRPDCPSCGSDLPAPKPRDIDLVYPPSPDTAAPA